MSNKDDDEEKRGKLRDELAGAILEHAATTTPAGKPPNKPPRKKQADSDPEFFQTAIGNGNIQVAGDWNGELNINTKEVHQHKFTPEPKQTQGRYYNVFQGKGVWFILAAFSLLPLIVGVVVSLWRYRP